MNGQGRLHQAPIGNLYEGMPVEEDIYNYSGSLLLRAGSKLDAVRLERVRAANRGQPYIYVSEKTFQEMRARASRAVPPAPAGPQSASQPAKLPCAEPVLTVNRKLEKETGYSGIVENSADIFKEVLCSGDALIEIEPVLSVSDEISQRLETTSTDVIFDLVNTIAPADEYLRRHIINVSMLNGLIGRWLGLPQAEIDSLVSVGLLHDTGKMMIPPEVLNAPRRLSGFEFEVIKMHTVYGDKLLAAFPAHIRCGAHFHHEKVDGAGYPKGLKGNDIPLTAKITAVSDVYDAMVSSRVYKGPESPFATLARLANTRGQALDAHIVDIFLRKMPLELIGKKVLLSNGAVGQVEQIDYGDIENPFIRLDGRTVKSGKELHCVSMYAV